LETESKQRLKKRKEVHRARRVPEEKEASKAKKEEG